MADEKVSEVYLTEMIRRGGEVIEQFLAKKIESLQPSGNFEGFPPRNLEFVTALCRIQKKPDPLKIFIEGPNDLTVEFPHLPLFDVTIRNVDVEKREVSFTESGDYRSGRQERWRIEVRDAAGTVRAIRQWYGDGTAGGIFHPTTLKPQEGWQTTLTMERFVETLEPGEYQSQVLYHNDLTIADFEFVTGLIVFRSEPLKLTVSRRSIATSKAQQQDIKDLLSRFNDRQRCKIIDGRYGPWAHKFIKLESDYGRLLALGWPAVPTLIEDLEREGQTPQRRAHLLSLLFSITGENDPRSPGLFRSTAALGSYSMLEQGWSISSKRAGEDEPSSSSSGWTVGPSTHKEELEAAAQAPFVGRWKSFSTHLDVAADD